jgi:hypothetical protein
MDVKRILENKRTKNSIILFKLEIRNDKIYKFCQKELSYKCNRTRHIKTCKKKTRISNRTSKYVVMLQKHVVSKTFSEKRFFLL